MAAKIKNSALFLAILISAIYAVCWVLFTFFGDQVILFSMGTQNQATNLQFLIIILYLSATTFLVFILMRHQMRRAVLLQSKLEMADEMLERRVKLRTAELEKSFGELKTLKGIIPICANCKSIRNGTGQWEKIEGYIQKRSEAMFSHGLCPDCDKALYGDNREHFETIANKYS